MLLFQKRKKNYNLKHSNASLLTQVIVIYFISYKIIHTVAKNCDKTFDKIKLSLYILLSGAWKRIN